MGFTEQAPQLERFHPRQAASLFFSSPAIPSRSLMIGRASSVGSTEPDVPLTAQYTLCFAVRIRRFHPALAPCP